MASYPDSPDIQKMIKGFRAELQARFGKDWIARPFWLNADGPGPARFSPNGVSLYIWKDRLSSAQDDPGE